MDQEDHQVLNVHPAIISIYLIWVLSFLAGCGIWYHSTTLLISSINGTNPVEDGKIIQNQDEIVSNKEYDSRVTINFQYPDYIANMDGSKGGIPSKIGAAHELIHAAGYGNGTNDRSTYKLIDPDDGKYKTFTAEEFNSRTKENEIRNEHNIKQRALPIPFFGRLF